MTHPTQKDFEDAYNDIFGATDKNAPENVLEREHFLASRICRHHQEIQFALRFTAKMMGEPSVGMYEEASEAELCEWPDETQPVQSGSSRVG